jgi:hypothetical protein
MLLGLVMSVAAVVTTAPASAADAMKPAGEMMVHHKVTDFAKWLPVFKTDKANQVAAGLTNPRVMHSTDDANDVVILFDYADLAKAKAFSSSDALKKTMQAAGVMGAPEIMYLTSAQ